MRICYITGNPNSNHIKRWALWFAHRGHDVHIISPVSFFYPHKIEINNVTVHYIRTIPKFSLNSHILSIPIDNYRIKSILGKIMPDVLHGHYLVDYGFRAAYTNISPLILTAWGSDLLVDPNMSRIARWEVKYASNRADIITCDADHMVGEMIKFGVKKEKIRIIYFGVDIGKFSPGLDSIEIREQLKLYDSPTIISLRMLNPIYDLETLIKAIPLVLKEVPNAIFIVAGKGSEENKLKNLAQEIGVFSNIRFIGYIQNDKLPFYYASSDIYVSTSLSDAGLSASTGEAMACGLPVLVTDFGDNKIWVNDGINGYVFPPRNHEILATKIIFLLKNKNVRNNLGQAGRKIIEEKNNWNNEMKKMENIYLEASEKSKV